MLPARTPLPVLTQEEVKRAFRLCLEGASIPAIRAALGVSPAVWRLLLEHQPFREELDACRRIYLAGLEDTLLTAHQDIQDGPKAALYSRNLQWLLERRMPEVYGQKVEHKHTIELDLKGAMQRARARVQAIDTRDEEWLCS